MPLDEEAIGALEENPISFTLSGPNERLSQNDQSNDEPLSDGDSVVQSPRRMSRRHLMYKEKGKKKMSEYDTNENESNRSESDSEKNEDGSSEMKFASAKRASKSAKKQLR